MTPLRGDVHYYNMADNCLDLTKLPRAKFVSEYRAPQLAILGALQVQPPSPRTGAMPPTCLSSGAGFLAQQL